MTSPHVLRTAPGWLSRTVHGEHRPLRGKCDLVAAGLPRIKHAPETLIQTVTFGSCLHFPVESNEETLPEALRQAGK
jgi:hypothetical protein